MRWLSLILLIGLLAVVAGCSDMGDKLVTPNQNTPPPDIDPTWVDDVSPIFTTNCTPCHVGSTPPTNGFDVSDYNAVITKISLAGNSIVTPGVPDDSELYLRLTGDGFSQMPPGTPLSSEDVDLIRQWIEDGAPENATP
ncbi:hypothetical protein K8I28_09605 [bacterium]|nr:hypothetical protein [bacterium]